MSSFVDTSVLIPLLEPKSPHHAWCREQIEKADRPVIVSDIVYAELSVGLASKEETDLAIDRFSLDRVGYSNEVLFRAGRAFLAYKANGGGRDSLLPDFLIGALAEAEGEVLITRDVAKIRTYFPTVVMINPD